MKSVMKSVRHLKQGLSRVRRAWLDKQYARAFREVNRLRREWLDNPHLGVLWADLIQLQETDEGPSLEEAKAAYERAVALDPESPEPLIELGHCLNAVMDDTKAASKCFAKAIDLSKRLLGEALLGQADALTELGRHQEAFDCLVEARWLQTHGRKEANGAARGGILERLEALRRAE